MLIITCCSLEGQTHAQLLEQTPSAGAQRPFNISLSIKFEYILTDCQWACFHISDQPFPSMALNTSLSVRLVFLCRTIHTHLPGKKTTQSHRCLLWWLCLGTALARIHTHRNIVSLDPCRIRSRLEQSWLRLGTQPELLRKEREATDLTDGKHTQTVHRLSPAAHVVF